MSSQLSRRGKQSGVLDLYGDYNPGGVMNTPLDDIVYGQDVSADGVVQSEDPPFFKGLSSYLLSAIIDPTTILSQNIGVDISWTFPNLALLNSLSPDFIHTTLIQVILQRSQSSRSTPFSQTGVGPRNANVNSVSYSSLPSDANWITLLDARPNLPTNQSDPPDVIVVNANTFRDTISPGHVYNYRLIAIVTTGVGSGVTKELDWNVVTVITPYELNYDGATVSWKVPTPLEMSILPGFGTLTATRCTDSSCFVSLNWVDPVSSPAPDSYTLYKTVDGTNFEIVATNANSPFNDGQQPPNGITFRYKVVANLHDGSTLASNIVSINHAGTIGT